MTNETEHEGTYEIEPLETPGPNEVPYPPELRITARSRDAHEAMTDELFDRWGAGETVPHVLNFERPEQLRELLTERRIELLESIVEQRPESLRDLATRLGRGVKEVAQDAEVLAEYGIVHFERDGRAKIPFVPYERVRIEIELVSTNT